MNIELIDTKDFNIKNAYTIANIAMLAYEEPDSIMQQLPVGSELTPFYKGDTQAIGINYQGHTILVIRGTEVGSIGDLKVDVNCKKINTPYGRFHKGFWNAFNLIRKDVVEYIRDYPNNRLWLGGHSLGAAEIGICGTILHFEEGIPFDGLYTIGCPRFADETAAKKYNTVLKSKTFRIVNNFDIVTRVPIRLQNFSHFGNFVFIDCNNELYLGANARIFWDMFWENCKSKIDDYTHLKLFGGLEDHSCRAYLRKIEANL